MKSLELEFDSASAGFGGYPRHYKQVRRNDNVAIYHRSAKSNGSSPEYEVFKISVIPKGTEQKFPNGNTKITDDDQEVYPGTSVFGRTAWTTVSLERAEEIFDRITKGEPIHDKVEPPEPESKEIQPKKEIVFPVGEFTVGELAEKNNVQYPIAFLHVKECVSQGSVKFIREERRNARGKASKIYAKV